MSTASLQDHECASCAKLDRRPTHHHRLMQPHRQRLRLLRFVASGTSPVEVQVPLTDASNSWFQDTNSSRFGGEFRLTIPFTIQNPKSIRGRGP